MAFIFSSTLKILNETDSIKKNSFGKNEKKPIIEQNDIESETVLPHIKRKERISSWIGEIPLFEQSFHDTILQFFQMKS